MKRVLPILLLAACSGREPAGPLHPPGSSFGRQPAPGTVNAGSPMWGAGDGMPLVLRAKFASTDLPLHVAPPGDDGGSDSLGVELGEEDIPYLGDELAAMTMTDGLLAAAEADAGLFVLWRTPPATAEAVLAAWSPSAGRLLWVADLAWSQETEEGIALHESWLADLDSDGRPELISRSRLSDATSGSVASTWSAWSMGPSLEWIERPLSAGERERFASVSDTN